MQIASKIQDLSTTVLILAGMLVWLLSSGDVATAASYIDSAHGSTSYGVNRSDTGYPTGDCAHCHDPSGPAVCDNEFMLFTPNNSTSQTDNFCFQCHKGDGPVQAGITNNDYGATFGAGTAIFTNIYDAFNPTGTYASSHDLATVQDYAKSKAWGSWMTADTNACLVCHDPHLSQKNFPVEINANGGVKTAVRRGNDVNGYPGDIWGDEPEAMSGRPEMMSDWTSGYIYQAPSRGDSGYEPGPAGSTIQDGSNLPNFVKACAGTCHKKSVSGLSAVNWILNTTADWPGTPSKHGRASADGGGFGVLKAPYSEASRGSYVLSCTDCHEPHGSTNSALLRTTVNGISNLQAYDGSSADGRWYYWCSACHDLTTHMVIWPEARCGSYVGCHLNNHNHGYQF